MRSAIVRAGSLIGVAGATLLVAGGGLAIAASSATSSVTGPEVVSGVVHGKAAIANTPSIPLTLSGVVATTDHGFVLGDSHSNTHMLKTAAGNLTVKGIGKQTESESLNSKTCRVTFIVRQRFTFAASGSTGKFAGASGPGAYQITLVAFVPRYTSGAHKGQCNTSNNVQPLAKGAVTTFLVGSVLTVS